MYIGLNKVKKFIFIFYISIYLFFIYLFIPYLFIPFFLFFIFLFLCSYSLFSLFHLLSIFIYVFFFITVLTDKCWLFTKLLNSKDNRIYKYTMFHQLKITDNEETQDKQSENKQ